MAFRFLVSMGSARASEPVTTRSGSVKNPRTEQPPLKLTTFAKDAKMMRISKKKSCTRLRELICPQSLQRRYVRDGLVKRNCGFRIANCGFYHTLGSVPHFVWFMIGLMQKSEKNVKKHFSDLIDHQFFLSKKNFSV